MIEMWFDDEFKPVKPKSLKQGRPRKRGRRNFFSPIISDDYKNVRLVIAAAFLQLTNNSCGKPAGLFFVLKNSTLRIIMLPIKPFRDEMVPRHGLPVCRTLFR